MNRSKKNALTAVTGLMGGLIFGLFGSNAVFPESLSIPLTEHKISMAEGIFCPITSFTTVTTITIKSGEEASLTGGRTIKDINVSCEDRPLVLTDGFVFQSSDLGRGYAVYAAGMKIQELPPGRLFVNSVFQCTRETWRASRWFGRLIGIHSDEFEFSVYTGCLLRA